MFTVQCPGKSESNRGIDLYCLSLPQRLPNMSGLERFSVSWLKM
uniref:Uncharacterized protein n=1 Tax=Arundo donax TaxID=35708 RepID=A0A0A9E268_ARUDO